MRPILLKVGLYTTHQLYLCLSFSGDGIVFFSVWYDATFWFWEKNSVDNTAMSYSNTATQSQGHQLHHYYPHLAPQ